MDDEDESVQRLSSQLEKLLIDSMSWDEGLLKWWDEFMLSEKVLKKAGMEGLGLTLILKLHHHLPWQ